MRRRIVVRASTEDATYQETWHGRSCPLDRVALLCLSIRRATNHGRREIGQCLGMQGMNPWSLLGRSTTAKAPKMSVPRLQLFPRQVSSCTSWEGGGRRGLLSGNAIAVRQRILKRIVGTSQSMEKGHGAKDGDQAPERKYSGDSARRLVREEE